jgi:hypothetical protein
MPDVERVERMIRESVPDDAGAAAFTCPGRLGYNGHMATEFYG